ncbi:hypothetical protein H1D31_01445 [Alishewanella sp. BS5-314]|uniref:hypothetical protein n=1 Tax=Alishewanella sp. BS5-314 TaxID=2755587 RepID=UPI0021BB52AD|nr:hypothetical protein [Alishewanella sp. BS5-314]MCT8124701.1 hypothetical protein [Alishewanella sp. BS5-314]
MDNQRINEQQALKLLRQWNDIGRDLPSIAKLSPTKNKQAILLLLPDYLCNQWYQVGETYSCYAEAMNYLGTLIDRTLTAIRLPN